MSTYDPRYEGPARDNMILGIAEDIVALVNSQPRTPTVRQFEELLAEHFKAFRAQSYKEIVEPIANGYPWPGLSFGHTHWGVDSSQK